MPVDTMGTGGYSWALEARMTPKRIKTIVHLDWDDRKALAKLSEKSGAPLSELIRRAVQMYIKQEAK
jgi:Ribbon-helix-helix protein, copG family